MEKKEEKLQNPEWFRIILTYVVAIGGIFALIGLVAIFLKFWVIGLGLIVVVIPLFPTMQAIVLRKKPTSPAMFFRIYVAELAVFGLQLGLLLVSAPFIAAAVGGVLACVLLVAAVVGWLIVGLQQLGLELGSPMSRADIVIFFRVTLGLVVAVGIFYLFSRLFKKYGDRYFGLWARQFERIREMFSYDVPG